MPSYNNPCDKCGSSDAVTIYEDGHSTCYSCNHQKFDDNGRQHRKQKDTPMTQKKELLTGGEYRDLRDEDPFLHRGIDKDVCEKFGVKIVDGQIVFPYYDSNSGYVSQKIRNKDFAPKGYWRGESVDTFFGQQLWQQPSKKLLVTEGEVDSLAAFQMFGKKYPVVSLRNGADQNGSGPVKEFKQNFEWLRQFEEIVLCFDNDEPGRVSAQKVAENIPHGKIKIMSMRKYKDANDYLLNKDTKTFTDEFWNARPFMPQDIVFGEDLRDRILSKLYQRKQKSKVKYPWPGVNDLTYGIRTGELVTLISGSGIGKTAVMSELVYHILTQTDEKVGLFFLEDSVEMANLRFASINAGKPYHLPDTEWTEDEIKHHLSETVELRDADGDSRVISFDHFGSNSIDELLFRVDHMVALGCKYIFLDHISIVVSDQSHGDERRALDEIVTKLRMKIQEHDIALFMVSHVRRTNSKPHEEGGQTSLQDIRGTQAIAQLSDIVIGLERDGQAEDEVLRNTTSIRILKNRLSGLTGLASRLYYIRDTGRLTEIEEEDQDHADPRDVSTNNTSTGSVPAGSEGLNKPPIEDDSFWEDGDDLPDSFMDQSNLAAG